MTLKGLDLVIDVGNSRTKGALFSGEICLRRFVYANGDLPTLIMELGGERPRSSVVGSVAKPDQPLLDFLHAQGAVLEVSGTTPSPLHQGYATPESLGVDRLANAVGGMRLFPGRPVLVIDLGSCITYDVIERNATYAGGAISPGMGMRSRSMAEQSARLPLVHPPKDVHLMGSSTVECLAAGVHHGILGELRGFIEAYGRQRPDMAVVLTGGDGLRFERGLKSGIFAHPFLTLFGLHAILEHNRG